MKNKIIELLQATERERVDKVIDYLTNKSDYFTAPASTAFHGNYPGGLAEHSLNVYNVAMKVKSAMVEIKPELASRLSDESIAIVTLLHDICKTNIYKDEKKKRKVNGVWEEYCLNKTVIGYDNEDSNNRVGTCLIRCLWPKV
jgi:23S rRNA maturation-related 3'-5' exoribonuclease YhaM